jgi:hypothetical protein
VFIAETPEREEEMGALLLKLKIFTVIGVVNFLKIAIRHINVIWRKVKHSKLPALYVEIIDHNTSLSQMTWTLLIRYCGNKKITGI